MRGPDIRQELGALRAGGFGELDDELVPHRRILRGLLFERAEPEDLVVAGHEFQDVPALRVDGAHWRDRADEGVQASGGIRRDLDSRGVVHGHDLQLVGVLRFVELVGQPDAILTVDLAQAG